MARADDMAARESSGSPIAAFIAPRVEFCGRVLHEPTLETLIALEAVKSPFLGSGEASLISIAEALLILSTDPEQLQDLVSDRQSFDHKVRAYARTIPLSQIKSGGDLLTQVLTSAWSTAMASESAEDGKKKTP